MAKKSTSKSLEILGLKEIELENLIKAGKVVIGTRKTLKNLKLGNVKKIYVASNCPEISKKRAIYYAQLTKTEANEIGINNKELGTLLKKPFNVAMFGILK